MRAQGFFNHQIDRNIQQVFQEYFDVHVSIERTRGTPKRDQEIKIAPGAKYPPGPLTQTKPEI